MKETAAAERLLARLEDANPAVRGQACRALGKLRDARAVEPLITRLGDAVPAVRSGACWALERLADSRAVGPLIACMGKAWPDVSRAARRALEKLGEAPLALALDKALRGRPKQLKMLVEQGDTRGIDVLVSRLRNPARPPELRRLDEVGGFEQKVEWAQRCAAGSLAALGSPALEPLLAVLADSAFNRLQMCEILGRLGDARAVSPLVPLLGDLDPRVREAAGEALEKVGSGKMARVVVETLAGQRKASGELRQLVAEGDRRPVEALLHFVRAVAGTPAATHHQADACKAAFDALGELGEPEALEPLIALVQALPTEAACRALGRLGDSRAVEPLIRILERRYEDLLVAAACAALGKLGDRRAVEPLIEVSRTSGPQGRAVACYALGRLGDGRAVEPLIACLKDRREGIPTVRQAACEALGRLGDTQATEHLIAALGDCDGNAEDTARVRSAAAQALEELGEGRLGRAVLGTFQQSVESLAELRSLAVEGDLRVMTPLARLAAYRSAGSAWAESNEIRRMLIAEENARRAIPRKAARDALNAMAKALEPGWQHLLCRSHLARLECRRAGGAVWFECRVCQKPGRVLAGVREVVAVLDQGWDEEVALRDGVMRINWLKHAALFDFDRVEILAAGDREVELFAIAVGNDTDECRRGRLKSAQCVIAESCSLSLNTLRILAHWLPQVTRAGG